MVRTVSGPPGRGAGSSGPASPAARPASRVPLGPGRQSGARQRAALFIRRHRLTPYALLLPSVVAIGLLLLWPTIQIAEFSFQNYGLPQVTGVAPTQWVGGTNFSATLSDPEFWLSLRISLIFAAVVVPLTLLTGTLVGLLLNRLGPKMATFVSSAAMLAWATPAVSASVIFIWLTDPDGGIVDWLLARMPSWLGGGAHWDGFSWTNSALPAYVLLTALVVWQGFPFVAVSVLAGLKTVPSELLESARVDGGGSWKIFWRVTYPLLKPIFLVLLLLSIIWDFGVFTQAYLVTGELGNRDEYNLGIYAYDRAFTMPPSYGVGSALALILTVILLIITIGYVRASVRQGAVE
jgi:N,N'-diacetylchitobiose transport system permease protein